MSTLPEKLEAAVDQIEADQELLSQFVNRGPTDPDVITEGGTIKPIAKIAAEAEATIAAFATGLVVRVAMPANSAAAGAVGQFAVNGDELAIYVGDGLNEWRFLTLFAK